MSARAKKAAAALPVPQSDVGAAALLREVGDLARARADLRMAVEGEIAALQERLATEDAPLKARHEAAVGGLEVWAAAHRERLTGGRGKTIRLATGVLAWRARPPKVAVARGALAHVLAALEAAGLERLLRRKVELDKEAILKEPDAITAIEGVSVGADGEEFVVEPFEVNFGAEGAA